MNSGGWWLLTTAAVAAVGGSGCASAPAPAPRTPSPVVSHTPAPTPTPTPVPPPSGPFAVVVTNDGLTGSSYEVLIIDITGRIDARVSAKLPLLKPNQTFEPSLVSASNTHAYYRSGDTDIWSLAVGEAPAVVKSIPAGSTSILGFSVSPDDTRIAVAVMNQTQNITGSSGRGYVEDLGDTNHHVTLWSNTDADSFRWASGWHGASLVDGIWPDCSAAGQYNCPSAAASYHVVDAGSGAKRATVCEAAPPSSTGGYTSENPSGLPVAAGTACSEYGYDSTTQTSFASLYSVNWSGTEKPYIAAKSGLNGNGPSIPVNGCFLDTDGSRMACTDAQSNAVTLVTPDGKTHSLGRRYTILGWIDSGHLLVDVDSRTLGVLTADTGAVVTVAVDQADKVAMVGTLPGSL